jgi:hypothetical protein
VGASLFYTLSLLMYHKHITRRTTLYLVASMMFGMCAMFTKEQGITVYAVCMVYEIVTHSSRRPSTVLRLLLCRSLKKLPRTAEVSLVIQTHALYFLYLHAYGYAAMLDLTTVQQIINFVKIIGSSMF